MMILGILCDMVESCVRLSLAGKLTCLLEEGAGEADDGRLSRRANVCRCKQDGQVKCGDIQDFELAV